MIYQSEGNITMSVTELPQPVAVPNTAREARETGKNACTITHVVIFNHLDYGKEQFFFFENKEEAEQYISDWEFDISIQDRRDAAKQEITETAKYLGMESQL